MKQTAVEWFYDQITRTYWDYLTTERQNELFQQAKEMEKEQTLVDYSCGARDAILNIDFVDAVKYYNETFKK